VGSGPEQKRLSGLAATLGIEENVTFVGKIRAAEIPRYLNASRIFAMCSEVEGLPSAMIEALSCGLPVVMPDVGDVTTVVIHEKNALILQDPTPANYAAAVKRLLADKKLYGQLQAGALKSREEFRELYSLETAKEIWENALFGET